MKLLLQLNPFPNDPLKWDVVEVDKKGMHPSKTIALFKEKEHAEIFIKAVEYGK